MTLYKVLAENGRPFHGGTGKWEAGKPRAVRGKLIACSRGIHYCTAGQLIEWLGPEIWTFEDLTPDETFNAGDKMVTRKGVILQRLDTWNERTARLFAADCADRALRLVAKSSGKRTDPRSRAAVRAARDFAEGKIGPAEWDAAWDAARDAARDAAWDAARDAARDAAWDAAWDAARDAARDAAWDAAWDAARAAEHKWQTKRLTEILEGKRYAA